MVGTKYYDSGDKKANIDLVHLNRPAETKRIVEIINETKGRYKARLKKHKKSLMLRELKTQQEQHKKISAICYDELKTQAYLKTHLLNNHEALLLFSLRSRLPNSLKFGSCQ